MNFKPKAYSILISIWATLTGNMSAVGSTLRPHQIFRMISLQNIIYFKEDYCFRIIISCFTILMRLEIYQTHNCKICMVEINQYLLMNLDLIYHCRVRVIKGYKMMLDFLFKTWKFGIELLIIKSFYFKLINQFQTLKKKKILFCIHPF